MKSANRKRLIEALDSFRESEAEFYQRHKECAGEITINRLWDFFQFDLSYLTSTLLGCRLHESY